MFDRLTRLPVSLVEEIARRLPPSKGPKGCKHDITLYNGTQANAFSKVRVTAISPATKIIGASGGTWTQVVNFPTKVEWTPPGGNAPIGTPIPNPFSIRVAQNNLSGKRVLLEWLAHDGSTACSQILATPCPGSEEPFDTENPEGTGTSPCFCVNAVITADPYSLELVEPDVDAEIDEPVRISRTQYKFPNISEVEPLGTPVQTQWTVTQHDPMGVENVITPPMTFDAAGSPTIDFPAPGTYTTYLHLTAPTCAEEEYEDDLRTVEIIPLEADFNWEQTHCMPNKIQFTDTSKGDVDTWAWELYDLNNNPITLPDPTLQNIQFTYPALPTGGQAVIYKVCLKITNSVFDTDQICKNISLSDACRAEFTWSYAGSSGTPPITVTFVNKSVGKCPAPTWNFGDPTSSSNTSTQFGPTHTYTAYGQYTVLLENLDSNGDRCSVTHVINLQSCGLEFAPSPCPDCTVVFKTTASNPEWSFPQGEPSTSTASEVKVKYPQVGTYTATLNSTNANFCIGTKTVTFQVTSCECCARNDREKYMHYFTYNGKDYRLKCKLIERNVWPWHYIRGKTKLHKKRPNGTWRAAKASKIQVRWDGDIHTSGGDCNCLKQRLENQDRTRTNRTKSKLRHGIGQKYRIREEHLTSTHFVKVDSGHSGETVHLKLGHDCD